MTQIPSSNFDTTKTTDIYSELLLPELITNVSLYIVKENINSSFYNISDFFIKHRVVNDDVKNLLKDKIIKLLIQKGYSLAYVFNKTGLIIVKSKEELDNSIWKSNLDFTVIKDC